MHVCSVTGSFRWCSDACTDYKSPNSCAVDEAANTFPDVGSNAFTDTIPDRVTESLSHDVTNRCARGGTNRCARGGANRCADSHTLVSADDAHPDKRTERSADSRPNRHILTVCRTHG